MPQFSDQTEHIVKRAKGAASDAIGALGKISRLVTDGLGLAHADLAQTSQPRKPPGSAPGIESSSETTAPPSPGQVSIQCLDYSPDEVKRKDVTDLEAFLSEARPEWSKVRWVNIDGLHPYVVKRFMERFHLHTLAAEDVLNTHQRPKVEDYPDHLFLILRMLTVGTGELQNEQISIFFFRDTVLTFQEHKGDVWDPVRQRIQNTGSRLRTQGTAYLLYALLDAVVDHCFPILEGYGDMLEELEDKVVENPSPAVQQSIHAIKRELLVLRRMIWPLRDVLSTLQHDEHGFFTDFARTYLRDVYDHAVQVIDILESYREMAAGLHDLYMSSVSNRMNEIMKVLTIMASFFIPITFIAGVYGMNFDNLPELHWKYSYAAFWIVCAGITTALAFYFWRKGWLGRK